MLVPLIEFMTGAGPTPTAVPTVFAATRLQGLTNYICSLSQLTIFFAFARFF